VKEMLQRRFPKLKISQGKEEIDAAIAQSDFLLHGSGPSLTARKDVARWAATGKPYGIYGITFPGYYGEPSAAAKAALPMDVELLTKAQFAYFRDSISLQFAKDHGVKCPIMGFAPDGAFAVDVQNDAAAEAFMKEHGLEAGRFLCVIPRQRFTPYWEIPSKKRSLDKKKEILYDKLPEDVKTKVVWRDRYWLTDEALSTYRRSAGMFGLEMHSPIMCIGHGIPAMVGRFHEQTSKGIMWRDIGLGEWLFDMDNEADIPKILPAALAMAKDPAAAKQLAKKGQQFVEDKQRETMDVLKSKLNAY
jgi:hypothetical protein